MFTGFTQETFDFLYGIHFNNERLWFQRHKEDYQKHLYEPLKELCREVFFKLADIYPSREFSSRVARIYKDARRYHGISPYKESLWFSIEGPVENWQDAPTFWFEIARDHWTYGMGYYAPKSATMARHRARIDAHPAQLGRLWADLLRQQEFTLQGESYAKFRPCPAPELNSWYNYKNFSIFRDDSDLNPLFHPDLVTRLVRGYVFLMPYYDYFLPLSEPREPGA